MSDLPMLSQGVIEKAEHVSKQLGMGDGQPWLHFDRGDEALFEILQGNIVIWASYTQRILVPGVAEPKKPPLLTFIESPPEFHCRNAEPRVGLNFCL